MASPAQLPVLATMSQNTERQSAQASHAQTLAQDVTEDEVDALEADAAQDTDSAFDDGGVSETTSMKSHYKGYFENGRRYQNVRTEEYLMPADDEQWTSMDQGHLLLLIADSQRSNPLFRSPLSENAQNVIDLGTGPGTWALDTADKFPKLTVRGIDLYPPPHSFVAPNCIFEVDDITQPWTWDIKFDLVHIRNLLGSFNAEDWKSVYRHIYNNTAPGGWIEHVEQDIGMFCDDDTLPADSMLRGLKETFIECAEKAGRPLDTMDKMRSRIEEAGFINLQHQDYKLPIGTWPKLQVWKDAGRVCKKQFMVGMDGWCMFLLTHFGTPQPWTQEEVMVFTAKVRKEIDSGYHIYNKARRVWAQKPYDEKTKAV